MLHRHLATGLFVLGLLTQLAPGQWTMWTW